MTLFFPLEVSPYFWLLCLFGGEIWWMENFIKKMGRKIFLSVFGWMGRKENKWWNPCIFSPSSQKSFLSKIERKLKREIVHYFWTKMPMYNKFIHVTFLHTLFFSFLFFHRTLLLFFSSSFDFFFYGHNFYFLINLGDWFFFCCLLLFWF